jgi:integrase
MATVVIQKRKGKKGMAYAIRYGDPITGKKKHYKTFRRLKDAQQSSNELRALLDLGKIPERKSTRFNPLTFSDVADSLRDEWYKRLGLNEFSEKTWYEYGTWLGALERTFGKRLLCQVTRDDVMSYREQQIEKNSAISANKYLSIMKAVFAHGLKIRAILENSVEDIPLLSEKAHERKRFLFPKELNKLIAATQVVRAKFYLPAIILLGAEHGASKQEILSLTWSDVDFDYDGKGLIHFFRTKNKRDRTEFLMPRSRKTLLEWKDHLEWKRHRANVNEPKSDYVFCRIDGTPLKRFDKAWRRSLELAGIKDFHFHDLRHTFCSNLILSGGSLKDAKEMIGHSDISMTDRYSHLSMEHCLSKQKQLAEHYSGGSGPQV